MSGSEGRERARQEFEKWLPSFAASLAWREPYNPAQLEAAFEAGRRSLEQERWISVEERLPEQGQSALISAIRANGERTEQLSHYYTEDKEWYVEDQSFSQKPRVTHWMPLPAPPVHKGDS